MGITLVQTDNREVNQLQNNVISGTQFLFKNPMVAGNALTSIELVAGTNYVNHKLGRTLQGWVVTRMRSAFAQIYDTQDSNTSPDKTLVLVSNVAVTVNLYVF